MFENDLSHARKRLLTVSLLMILSASGAFAQTTSFTYQGRLSDGGTPANGTYDLQFTLWDASSLGTQQPQPAPVTVTRTSVLVTGGIFAVQLDFGANAFPGADRFLEISARLNGTPSFTTLSPRQQITSTPYAIRSLNASSADAVTVNGVPGGSGNYIQNATTPQASSNFNISGNGTAGGTLSGNIVNAMGQFNLGGRRVLSVGNVNNNNIFVGGGDVGTSITDGFHNSFVGGGSGGRTTDGFSNSFFGANVGGFNVGGSDNTLIGAFADVGSGALTNASAIGACARVDQSNSLVLGSISGCNTNAFTNVGIGTTTPQARLDVNGTALFRGGATVTGTNGDGAVLTARRPTGDPYVIIDATTVAQNSVLAFRKNNFNRWLMYADSSTESGGNAGSDFKLDAYNNGGGIANYLFVTRATGNVGIGTSNPSEKLSVNGKLRLEQIDSGFGAGTVQLCRNAANVIATCTSSSLRYKQGITPFRGGLELLRGLRPISFTWKMDGSRDVGLGAEDVAKVEPLLVTHNDKGEIEGVKYDRLNIVLINAVKQQQEQIETLRTANAALSARLQTVEKVLRKKAGSSRRRR